MSQIDGQIKTAVANGLTRNAIEALLGIKFNNEQLDMYRKCKAIYDLKLRQRRKERKYEHLSGAEAKRKHDDKYASIDDKLDQAFAEIDWPRRKAAEKSIASWVQTYCIGILLDDAPPPKGKDVLQQMAKAISSHSNYLICMPRGQGKTSYVECVSLYALALGLQKYVVIISNNARAACGLLSDLWRAISEPDTAFAQDYPEVCFPFQVARGSYRRKQTYRGKSTEICKNAGNIVLARLRDADGNELKTSGSVVTVRGISSGLRGMKHGKMRPSLVLLDDLQTTEIAENPAQVEKLMSLVRKDVMNLGGKERLTILQTATPIQPEDLVEKLKNDINWKTTTFKAIEKFPKDLKSKDSLWEQYFKQYDAESITGEEHAESLEFYRQHQAQMDDGAEVFNPYRYSLKDGHISAIQKLLEIQHVIGNAAFQSEYQMSPIKSTYSIDISPSKVLQKISDHRECEVPDGHVFVAGAIDLNTSYAATATLVAFKPDTTAAVIWHQIFPINIDQKLPDAAYSAALHDTLLQVCSTMKGLNIKIDGLAIDAGGRNWDAVCSFTKVSMRIGGIPACAFAGRSANIFNPFVRSRLRDAIGRTVLCGDAQEHVKSGAGKKYVFFDADFYKEAAQRALLCPVGAVGSCTLYYGDVEEHRDFALQVCNEKLRFVQHKAGRDIYNWASKEPHDFLDCMSMCYAVAASQGISGQFGQTSQLEGQQRQRLYRKPRVKIV